MIQVKNITYKKILENISFSACKGEIISILGANGAGKSTLLKILYKEYIPSSGSIILNNKNLNDYSTIELAKCRSVLSQKFSTSIAFNVEDLVLMGRYPHFGNTPKQYDLDIVYNAMKDTGILHLSKRNYSLLSGGEQQQVQIARMLAQVYDTKNSYLFLDEPTSSLDIFRQRKMLKLLKNLSIKGFSVICILHDINLASMYADKILLLKQGKMIDFGSPQEAITCVNIHETYETQVDLMSHKTFNCPLVIPI